MNRTTVPEVGGLHWATSTPAIESTLLRRPGASAVEANAANQTATVTYDPDRTSVKAPGQRLADKAAFWLVLVALIGGVGTFLVWWLVDGDVQTALLFAITVVVITCPDALGLVTPTAIMVGTGLGAKRGVLFENATGLETSARIDTVVMDKTGTLTKGEPEVTDVVVDGLDEDELLTLVTAVERESEHPLAGAIVRYATARDITGASLENFRNVPGHGAVAEVDGRRVAVGNRKLMIADVDFGSLMDRRDTFASTGRTAVLVAVDGRGVGVIALADARGRPRPRRSRRCPTSVSKWSCSPASTTPPRSHRRIWASPSAPAPTSPSKPPTWC